jgi:hypothetical protein
VRKKNDFFGQPARLLSEYVVQSNHWRPRRSIGPCAW